MILYPTGIENQDSSQGPMILYPTDILIQDTSQGPIILYPTDILNQDTSQRPMILYLNNAVTERCCPVARIRILPGSNISGCTGILD